jgi:hypothetical protein
MVPTAHRQIWAARSELIAGHWTPGFMVTTSVGTPSRPPLTGGRMAERGWLLKAQLSGPEESVTALRKLRVGTPGLLAGAAGFWPDGWCVKSGLIEWDLALAVCAKLLTIEIFLT